MTTLPPRRSVTPRLGRSLSHAVPAALVAMVALGCADPSDDGSNRGTTAGPAPIAPAPIDASGRGGTPGPGAAGLPSPEGEGTSLDEHPRVATFAGLRAPKPPTWQWQSPRPMRAGNWTVPGRSGGDFAELTAFVGIGGGNEANLTRWVGQFRSPEMRTVEPVRWQLEVPGLGATAEMIQLVGEFGGMSGSFKPQQALLGAVFDSPVGPVQLKFTGPEDVVLGARADFEAMVAGLAPRAMFPLPSDDGAPAGSGADAGTATPAPPAAGSDEAVVLDPSTDWPMAWFMTAGDPPARRARHTEVQGNPAPVVQLEGVMGGESDLEALRGSIVVVDFWGTWCAPCMKAIPKMIELQDAHRSDDVVFLGVHSTLPGPRTMEAAAEELGINYVIGRDIERTSEQAWGVRQWPYYAIIGRDGIVKAAGLRSDFVGKAIERMLAEERGESA